MKIAYFGFDLFYSCLEMLASTDTEIIKIFTCKVDEDFETTHKTFKLAKAKSIPVTYEKVTRMDIEFLEKNGCDLIVSAGYYHKIPCSAWIRSVNVHPALLPLGRGPWPMPVSILRGDTKTGVTLHELTDAFDEGDIILQKCVDIKHEDNLETLTHKLQNTAKDILCEFISDPDRYWNNKIRQVDGEYWKEPGVKDMTFTLDSCYDEIDRITKAFYGFCCYLTIGEKVTKIKKSVCVKDPKNAPPDCEKIAIDGGYLCILKLT